MSASVFCTGPAPVLCLLRLHAYTSLGVNTVETRVRPRVRENQKAVPSTGSRVNDYHLPPPFLRMTCTLPSAQTMSSRWLAFVRLHYFPVKLLQEMKTQLAPFHS